MFEPERIEKIAELLRETNEAHRDLFSELDGENPEWPTWFAGQMTEGLNEILEAKLEPAAVAQLLVEAEQEHVITAPGREWPGYYAEFLIARVM